MRHDIPEIIKKSKNEELLNVFFVVSPVTAMIFRMIIDFYKINPKNVLLISFRNSSLDMFSIESLNVMPKSYDRYIEKLFFISPTGNIILNKIKKFNKKFLIYATSSYREVNWVLNDTMCLGHIYIEEGQASYMNWKPYAYNNMSLLTKIKNNWKNRIYKTDGIGHFYRDDAYAFIGISNESFPSIESSKKFLLKNFNDLKKYYKPIHMGIHNIGLTCADRRLDKSKWKEMFEKLAREMNYNGVIKLHPSFNVPKSKFKEIQSLFNSFDFSDLKLSPNNCIIELEMLYEEKYIYGPRTSIERYSKVFGSNFKHVKLY